MSATPTHRDAKCPHCGANIGRNWKTCWLCGLELPASPPDGAPLPAAATAIGPTSGPGTVRQITQIVGFLLAGTILLLMIGLIANGEVGGVVALVILLMPAGLVTFTKSLNRRAQGVEMQTQEKVGTFLLSLAVTIGAVVALGVAAFIALCIFCFAMLAGGNVNFH